MLIIEFYVSYIILEVIILQLLEIDITLFELDDNCTICYSFEEEKFFIVEDGKNLNEWQYISDIIFSIQDEFN